MIDLHCHIDLYPNPQALLQQAEQKGIYILAVTTTPSAWKGTNQLIGIRKRIKVALGLHPELVAERHKEIDLFCSLLPEASYVGEVGLDGSPRNKKSFALQETVLSKIFKTCENAGGKILSLHSRRAVDHILDMLSDYPSVGTPILHWFTGTKRELEKAINLGCWFSVGPAMLQSKNGQQLIEHIPRERILTETDGPFTQNNGMALMPWDVNKAEIELAKIWNIEIDEVKASLLLNLKKLANTKKEASL